MPLYLVRWPNLTASLIRASTESELLQIIDEEDDPSRCTWREYRGSVWIDFNLKAKVSIDGRVPGRLRADEVTISRSLPTAGRVSSLVWSVSDTSWAMEEDVIRQAFPTIAEVVYGEGAAPTRERLDIATRADLAGHASRTVGRGVTLDPRTDDFRLLSTETVHFRWQADRGFRRMPSARFEAFIFGQGRVRTGTDDGRFHAAKVRFTRDRGQVIAMEVVATLCLGVGPSGKIAEAHRADAGDGQEPTETLDAFIQRRNKAVHWKLDKTQRQQLRAHCARLGPRATLEFND